MNIPRPELMYIFMLVFLAWIFVDKIYKLSHQIMSLPLQLLLVWYGIIFYSVIDYFRLDLSIFYRGADAVSGLFLALFALASYVRYRTAREMFNADEDALVTTGPYRLVRHPEYASFLLQVLALALAFGSAGGCAMVIILGIPLTVLAVRAEEKEAAGVFGENYSEYKKRTKILIPFVW